MELNIRQKFESLYVFRLSLDESQNFKITPNKLTRASLVIKKSTLK